MRWRGRARDWERQKLRERERVVDFKKLAHTVMKADNYKICQVRQRLTTQARARVTVYVQKPSAVRIPCCLG